MIQLEVLSNYFPPLLWKQQDLRKYMVKEYLQLLILDYLSATPFIKKVVFIGGTSLRLVKGIDHFSEDIDFDCKDMSGEEFIKMTDNVVLFLQRYGLKVETRDKASDKLKAYRRNIHFPGLLFELGLSRYREERFLIKIESQDQDVYYKKELTTIKGCGMYFKFPVPSDEVLCAMKISALLSRQKGRDFYDVMFLMDQARPDFSFLLDQCGINNMKELKEALQNLLEKVDLAHKSRDFEHLVFDKKNTRRILLFKDFVEGL